MVGKWSAILVVVVSLTACSNENFPTSLARDSSVLPRRFAMLPDQATSGVDDEVQLMARALSAAPTAET